jgi:hypothetical protein
LPDLVFESQGALGSQERIGLNSDNPVTEVEIIGSVVTMVKANIENKLSIAKIRAAGAGHCCACCHALSYRSHKAFVTRDSPRE